MLKVVTILFLDIVGSTARTGSMSPDEARDLVGRFLDVMGREVEAQGGRVDSLLGDGFMALFGIPAAREGDPVLAVRAAKRMLRKLEDWNRSEAAAQPFQVRIGINTGEVSTGGPSAESLMVMGDTVNVASRLESAAEPGTVLIGERTARRVRDLYLLRPRTLSVKGKSEQLKAFVVEEQRELPQLSRLTSPLVGRESEVAWLTAEFEATEQQSRPRVANLLGEAGVGKSRLLREFEEVVERRGSRVLVGRCLPYGEAVTLWPLGEILKAEAGILGGDDPRLVSEKIAKLVLSTIGGRDQAAVTAALLSTLGGEATGERADPRAVYRNLLWAWGLLLQAMAASSPLVVLIEDIHWADPTMLDVVAWLSDTVQGSVLFLCSERPGQSAGRGNWPGDLRDYSSLSLQPLSREDSTSLLGVLLDPVTVPEEVRDSLAERAEGNPFFLEEMIGHLADEGLLSWNGSSWVATGEISVGGLPERVQDVILARLDLLTPVERTAIQHAAVVGRTFWLGGLAALVTDTDLLATLNGLRGRRLITQRLASTLGGEVEFGFKHALIADVSAQTLPRKTRGVAHKRIADWIETKTRGRNLEYAELLAHHRHQAADFLGDDDLRALARNHYLDATRIALGRFALSQADALGHQSLRLARDPLERACSLELLGDVHHFGHRGNQALDMYLQAIEQLRDQSQSEAMARLCARCAILSTRWEGTLESPLEPSQVRDLIERGLAAAGDDDGHDRALLLASRAFLQGQGYETRDDDGRKAAEGSLQIAERIGDPNLISAALDACAFWLFPDARYRQIYKVQLRRAALADELTDVRETSDALISAAWSATMVGRYAEAAEFASRGLELARGVDPGQFLYALSWNTFVRFLNADWDAALCDLAELEALESLDSDGLPIPFTAVAYAVGAFIAQLRDQAEVADRYIRLMEEYRRRQEAKGLSIGVSRMVMARCLAHRGESSTAQAWLSLERGTYLVCNLEGACEVTDPASDLAGAVELIEIARAEAERGGVEALPLYADRLEARVALERGDQGTAARLLRSAATGFDRLGASWEAARSRLLMIEALHGASSTDPTPALAVFERLGSVAEARRLRAHLEGAAPVK
jgi:class 3 adenylate cyclase